MSDNPAIVEMACRLIRQMEGFVPSAQPDGPGRWVVGWGFDFLADGTPVTEGTQMTMEQADAELELMVEDRVKFVLSVLKVPASDAAVAAFVDFAWNEGEEALAGSEALREFNAGRPEAAAGDLLNWVYADGKKLPGLVRRRQLEGALLLGKTTV